MNNTKKFIDILFQEITKDNQALIWTIPDKYSYWCKGKEEIIKIVNDIPDNKDIYIGVGFAPDSIVDDYGRHKQFKRCKADDISGIFGLWADIDVAGPGHAKTNLPPTKEDALKLVDKLPFEPTIIIDSGHGIQCWWIFKEFWEFEDKAEREEGADLAKRWIYTIKAEADKNDWDVDSTTDLSRVMRLPGTYNNKAEQVPVKIIKTNESNKYNPVEFEPYLIDLDNLNLGFSSSQYEENDVDDLDLNPKAHPPFDKWEALKTAEPNVERSWKHERNDLQDQSASSYDMSLAVYCAQAEWSDNEIAHLMIAHRRKHNENLKLRQDYYKRTIYKARKFASKNKSVKAIDLITDKADEIYENGTHSEKQKFREDLLKSISNLFDVEIIRFVKYTSDPPQYKLETSKGNIMVGSAGNVVRQNSFRNKVYAATNILIPKFKSKQWDDIVQALGKAAVEESLGEEATDAGMARSWINRYLQTKTITEDKQDAVEMNYPFRDKDDDNKIYIFGNNFRKWLKISEGEMINAKEMGAILRAYGCTPTKLNINLPDGHTTRSVWEIPDTHNFK